MPAVNQYQLHCVCNTGDSYYGLCCIMVRMCILLQKDAAPSKPNQCKAGLRKWY